MQGYGQSLPRPMPPSSPAVDKVVITPSTLLPCCTWQSQPLRECCVRKTKFLQGTGPLDIAPRSRTIASLRHHRPLLLSERGMLPAVP